MTTQKPALRSAVIFFAIAAVFIAGGTAFMLKQRNAGAESAAGSEAAATETAAGDAKVAVVKGFPGNTAGPMGERTLGDPNAPIKITEYSSLTCGHCGHFHKETLPQLKKNYIDTGLVFLRLVDFPLNAPALTASMTARCLPQERYYDFLQLLFTTQEAWATQGSDYMSYLKQNAQLAGLDNVAFNKCIDDMKLKEFIATRMQDAAQKNEIQSTPTFVLDSGEVIRGAQPYQAFVFVIDKKLAELSEGESPAQE